MTKKTQLIFWLLCFVGVVALFSQNFDSLKLSIYFVLMLFPVVIGTSIVFNQILVPKYLLKKKYVVFGLYLVYLLIISFYLESTVITLSFVFLADYSFDNIGDAASNVYMLTLIIYLVVFLFSFVQLIQYTLRDRTVIQTLEKEVERNSTESIQIRSNRKLVNINFRDINYIESLDDYINIHLSNCDIINSRNKISKIHESLPNYFIRIHRSFIINKSKITFFNKQQVYIGDKEFNISRSYKTDALEALGLN